MWRNASFTRATIHRAIDEAVTKQGYSRASDNQIAGKRRITYLLSHLILTSLLRHKASSGLPKHDETVAWNVLVLPEPLLGGDARGSEYETTERPETCAFGQVPIN